MTNKKPAIHNILFCGVGGQGVLTASEICGTAAMLAGYHIKKSEVKGMSQRGGSVDSHVRFGKRVFSPLIPKGQADFLVPFNIEEGLPLKVYLKKEGLDLAPVLTRALEKVTDKRFVNTYMLGALSAFLPIETEHWLAALSRIFKRAQEENKTVFIQGLNEGKNYDIQRKT
jgi:indolepyruvate ferredoxin oxidoreductase, beta subunit